MVVGGGLFTWIITFKKKKINNSFWNPGGSFSFVAETVYYSTVLGKQGSRKVAVPRFNGEDTGWFQTSCVPQTSLSWVYC